METTSTSTSGTPAFATLLKDHRLAAGLTQEGLAERAGLSARGIQNLEAGARQPYPNTLERLISAFGLVGEERARFEAAGRSLPRHGASVGGDSSDVAPRHNLPAPLTALIGRDHEAADVRELLNAHRLVTLTGPGGIGKTRLALSVAGDLVDDYEQGIWLVELAALAESSLVARAVAAALAIREQPAQALVATLVASVRARRLLVVLDNCEHLLDACAHLADALLRGCPGLRILATSREALGIAGETSYQVPSLAAPDQGSLPPVASLLDYDAVRLFVERARAVRPEFALTVHNAAATAQVCARLDGIPLALELAAARLRGLTVERLAERLDQWFRLLTGGSRTALPRQRTLLATIDWSYDLLEEPEQRLFQRLAVFAGGWTLEAAEAVCASEKPASDDILELLLRLVDKSLVLEEGGRYRLLETMRQYARERLRASGENDAAQAQHAAFYLSYAEQVERELTGGNAARLNSLDAECDNMRAALGYYAFVDDVEALLRLAGALRYFWMRVGYLSEGRRWLDDAVSRRGEVRPGVREQALREAGLVAFRQGDFHQGEAHLRQSVAGYRRLGDRRGVAWALTFLANATMDQGKFREAAAYIDEALLVGRDQGDPQLLGNLIHLQGIIAREEGEFDLAQIHMDEALAIARSLGGWPGRPAQNLHNLGALAEDRKDYARARSYLRESLTLTRQAGYKFNLPFALDSVASLATLEGRPGRALRLAAAAAAWRERIGMLVPPMWRPRVDRTLERAREQLDAETAAAAWAAGQALTMEEAIAEALDEGGEG